MRRITRAMLALFISAAIVQMVGTATAAAASEGARDFARRGGIEQPPYSTGTRPLLVIAIRFAGAADEQASGGWVDSFDRSSIARRFLGSTSTSVNGYMNAASRGAFSYVPAHESNGVADDGIVEVSSPNSFNDYPTLWGRAIAAMQAADNDVFFGSYDTDGDGQLEATELTLEIISMGAGARDAGEADSIQRSGAYLTIDNVSLAQNFWAAEITPHTNFMTTVHELFHASFATVDEYGSGVGALSVMGPTAGIPDSARFLPSAVTRFQLGWVTPAVVTGDGSLSLRPGDAVIVADTTAGASRYFMVEYREQNGLDASASGSGMVVWRVDNAVARGGNGMTRAVELVTPRVLATDRRIDPCASGEHAMCHSGDAGDLFGVGRGDVVPLRYQATDSRNYSAGTYAGVYLSDVSGGQGVHVSVHFGDVPTAAGSTRSTVASSGVGARTVRSVPSTVPAAVVVDTTTSTTEVATTTAAVRITRAPVSRVEAETLLRVLCRPDVFDC